MAGWRQRSAWAVVAAFWCIAANAAPPSLSARAWILMDTATDQVLAERNSAAPQEIESLATLMTAYVGLSALKTGAISPDKRMTPTPTVATASGPRMGLTAGAEVTVQELLAGVATLSAADAALTLADAVEGSEAAFVERMNLEAQRLGLKETSFRGAAGQRAPGQVTSARDLARLAAVLIRDYPAQYRLFGQRSLNYRGVQYDSRNRLLWLDPVVDGLKAGQTHNGWQMVASALRGPRRLVAVVLGAPSEAANVQETLKLLNYGYQAYDSIKLFPADGEVKALNVWMGSERTVRAGFLTDLVVAVPSGRAAELKLQMNTAQPLKAPLRRGDRVGTLSVKLGDAPIGDFPLLALDDIPRAGWLRRSWDALRLWLN